MAISNLTHFAFGWGWAGAGGEDLILTIFSRCRNSWLSKEEERHTHTQGQRAQLRCKYQRNIFRERNCAQHSRHKVPLNNSFNTIMQSKVYPPPPFWCPFFRVLLHKVFPQQRRGGYIIDVCVCVFYSVYKVEREPSWRSGKRAGILFGEFSFKTKRQGICLMKYLQQQQKDVASLISGSCWVQWLES